MTAVAVMNPVDILANSGNSGCGSLTTPNQSYQVTKEQIAKAKDYLVAAIRKYEVNREIQTKLAPPLQQKKIVHAEIMSLLLKIMLILFDDRVLEKLFRKAEHDEQVKYLLQTVNNFSDHGSALRNTAIAGAVASFVAAFLPMFGYTSLGERLKGWISPLNKMGTPEAYKQWGKMADIGRRVSENVSQMQTAYREGDRAWWQQKTDIARTEKDEGSRKMQHSDEDIRNVLTMFARILELLLQETRAAFQ